VQPHHLLCCAVLRWGSITHGMKRPLRTKIVGAFRPLERGLQEVSALAALPTLVAIIVASLRILDYRAHRYLLVPFFAFVVVMAKDGEVAFWFQPFVVPSL